MMRPPLSVEDGWHWLPGDDGSEKHKRPDSKGELWHVWIYVEGGYPIGAEGYRFITTPANPLMACDSYCRRTLLEFEEASNFSVYELFAQDCGIELDEWANDFEL